MIQGSISTQQKAVSVPKFPNVFHSNESSVNAGILFKYWSKDSFRKKGLFLCKESYFCHTDTLLSLSSTLLLN